MFTWQSPVAMRLEGDATPVLFPCVAGGGDATDLAEAIGTSVDHL